MRKILLSVAILGVTLLLSGCAGKEQTLTCDINKTLATGIHYTENQNLLLKGGKVTEYKLKDNFDLSDYGANEEEIDAAVKELRAEYAKAVEKGVQTDVYPEGNHVIVVFTFNPELFDGYLDYLNIDLSKIFGQKLDVDATKSNFEAQGYRCNISK